MKLQLSYESYNLYIVLSKTNLMMIRLNSAKFMRNAGLPQDRQNWKNFPKIHWRISQSDEYTFHTISSIDKHIHWEYQPPRF